ncbi:Mariner Mos1 transposase, partial [Acromyrmex echinatior]
HLRQVLIFCFNWKKSAAEAHRMLVEVYGDTAPTDKACREWFRRFKDGDFSVEDKPRSGQLKNLKTKNLK